MSADQEAVERIGVYRVQGRLGRGGMGEVLLAYDDRLHRPVAIKRIRHDAEMTPGRRERFRREARAAAALDHPAVVRVYDVVFEPSSDSIVMELVQGRTLARVLERGGVDGATAVSLARGVAEGLAEAHRKGLVHRDLKAENVMVTADGQPKILDFGLVKPVAATGARPLTLEGGVLGTSRAMSPEQARGEAVDARSDLFSLGVLLYEMLSGRSPFEGHNELATLERVIHHHPPPLGELRRVPPPLASLVERLLAKAPEERPQSAAEAADALARIAEQPGLESLAPMALRASTTVGSDAETGSRFPAPPTASKGRRPSRRAWAWAGAVAAVGLLAVEVYRARQRPAPIRVAVLRPVASSDAAPEAFDFVAFAVWEASLSTLVTLQEVEVLDPLQRDDAGGSLADRQRIVEADEVLRTTVGCRGDWCQVSYHRLRGSDGTVLATSQPFEVPAEVERSLELADAVRVHLRRTYPDRAARAPARADEVRPRDYATFITLQRRADDGERLGEEELEALESLLRTSPGLLEARLLAASVARYLPDMERSREHTMAAQEMAPTDARPLFGRFRVELESGELETAGAIAAELRRLAPDDVRVWRAEAELLEARGRLDEALALQQRIVERRGSWRHVLDLARLEVRLGEEGSARRRLAALLERQPGNHFVLANLAFLEAQYGDLRRAADLYRDLVEARPARSYFQNLGWTQFLLGDHRAAAANYERALSLAPGNVLARFNLATARQAAGERDAARRLFADLLRDLGGTEAELDPHTSMLKAQCLVRLGQPEPAEVLAERALERAPDDVRVLHQAAQVYALLEQRLAALFYTERCLKAGLRREWLEIPAFDALRSDPDFAALLEGARRGVFGGRGRP